MGELADIIQLPTMTNQPKGKRTQPGTKFLVKMDLATAEAVRAKAKELRVTYPELITHCCRVVLGQPERTLATLKPKGPPPGTKPKPKLQEDLDLDGF